MSGRLRHKIHIITSADLGIVEWSNVLALGTGGIQWRVSGVKGKCDALAQVSDLGPSESLHQGEIRWQWLAVVVLPNRLRLQGV